MMWSIEMNRKRTVAWARGGFLVASLIGLLLSSLVGCGSLPFRVEGERPLWGTIGPQRKTVAAKEPPGRLIAVDGTFCIVPAPRFESAEVGDRVWCTWRVDSES